MREKKMKINIKKLQKQHSILVVFLSYEKHVLWSRRFLLIISSYLVLCYVLGELIFFGFIMII